MRSTVSRVKRVVSIISKTVGVICTGVVLVGIVALNSTPPGPKMVDTVKSVVTYEKEFADDVFDVIAKELNDCETVEEVVELINGLQTGIVLSEEEAAGLFEAHEPLMLEMYEEGVDGDFIPAISSRDDVVNFSVECFAYIWASQLEASIEQ